MDDRFKKVLNDPKFRTIKKKDRKLKIDKRFKSMFEDDKFKLKYVRDKRGKSDRRNMAEDYKRFYRLSDEEDDVKEENDEIIKKTAEKKISKQKVIEKKLEDESEHEEADEEIHEEIHEEADEEIDEEGESKSFKGLTHEIGYHRGLIRSDDESSSSSSESEEEGEDDELEHEWNELDRNANRAEDISRRIAICNADWDRFNAQDIFVLLNSFKPLTGVIESVKVYYSKFGEERLKIEETKGPSEFIYGKGQCILPKNNDGYDVEEDEDEDENGNKNDSDKDQKNMEKLRKYQLERLKYFYALVICDSSETADAIYKELDGMEYESSATTLDLRFVPDEMNFDDVKIKEECSSMPNTNYKPPEFINTALQQSQVKLTWDETDPKRKQIFEKAFNKEYLEDDLKAYLASSSDDDDITNQDEEEEDEGKIDKYKRLLGSLDKDDDEVDMQVSWNANKDKNDKDDLSMAKIDEHNSENDSEQSDNASEDPEEEIEKPIDRKEKFNKKKNHGFVETETDNEDTSKLELLMMDVDNNNTKKKHFNYKDIVTKYSKNKNIEDDFKFDAEDPRFMAIYDSPNFNVDQSHPNFKRTSAFKHIIETKKKRRTNVHKRR